MKIKHLRNATEIITFGKNKFLIDPMLSEKGMLPPFPSLSKEENNPLDHLPVRPDEFLSDIDAVIVTHSHVDHWDVAAEQLLNKELPIFIQNEKDLELIQKVGFQNVQILENETKFNNIKLYRTEGQHFNQLNFKDMIGDTMGVIFESESEPKLYLAGDTIWFKGVEEALVEHKPEVIVLNAGGNQIPGCRLVMNENDVYEVHKHLPNSALIAVHMEAVNHWELSKEDLREFSINNNFEDKLFIPNNGTELEF